MNYGGTDYNSILIELHRIAASKIVYTKCSREDASANYNFKQDLFVKEMDITFWIRQVEQVSIFESFIKISKKMAEILESSLPLQLDVVREIGQDVLTLDYYIWKTWRNHVLLNGEYRGQFEKRSTFPIPLDEIQEQLGSSNKNKRRFKMLLKSKIEKLEKIIQQVTGNPSYRDSNFISDKHNTLVIRPVRDGIISKKRKRLA